MIDINTIFGTVLFFFMTIGIMAAVFWIMTSPDRTYRDPE